MLETARERVSLLKAGIDGKTIEHLYIILNNFNLVGCNSRKINCWEFVGCYRKSGKDPEAEGCKASCKFSHKVREEEGNAFVVLKNNTNESMAETTTSSI